MADEKCPWAVRKAYNDYYCTSVNKKVSMDDFYLKYCTSYSYDDCPFYKRCYVATEVCNELGVINTTQTLNTLYHLRYGIMEQDEQYKEALQTYDTVGPDIVEKMSKPYMISDGEKQVDARPQIFRNLYDLCMVPVKEQMDQNNNDEAVKLYKDTMNLLIQGYNQQTDEKGKVLLFK